MPILRGVPDWALYAGGGVALGGGYLLYKKRKAASSTGAGAAPVGTAPAASVDLSGGSQQPSIVPYYLTGGQSGTGFGGRRVNTTQGPPLPTPSGPPGGSNVDTTSGGTSIPPILPPVNTTTNIPQPPAPPAPSVAAPTPAPATQVANLDPSLVAKINANGEQLIGNLIDPLTGGTWWFGSKGGVFTAGPARYLGSVPGSNALYPGFQAVQAIPLGTGYCIVSSKGETYNYGG